MPIDVITEVVIDRPLEEVAAFASEPSNAPQWYLTIDSVTWKTERPLRVGSQVAFVATFLGRKLEYTFEIVDHAQDERLVMRTSEGPFPMETEYTWEALSPTRTRMTLRNSGEPKGFPGVVGTFVKGAMRRANRKDLDMLKALLEQRA